MGEQESCSSALEGRGCVKSASAGWFSASHVGPSPHGSSLRQRTAWQPELAAAAGRNFRTETLNTRPCLGGFTGSPGAPARQKQHRALTFLLPRGREPWRDLRPTNSPRRFRTETGACSGARRLGLAAGATQPPLDNYHTAIKQRTLTGARHRTGIPVGACCAVFVQPQPAKRGASPSGTATTLASRSSRPPHGARACRSSSGATAPPASCSARQVRSPAPPASRYRRDSRCCGLPAP